MIRFITFLILLVSIYSCQHCECVSSFGLRLGLISFDSADINKVVIRKFEKGTNFNHLLDTSIYDNGTNIFYPGNDTFEMRTFPGDMPLKSNFDYEVNFPSANRTYKITDINEPQVDGNCRLKIQCVNLIESCKLDGNFVSTSNTYETVYLRK